MTLPQLGPLESLPALDHPDLLGATVAEALQTWPGAPEVAVAAIDPELADTAAFCATYGVGLDISANCVVLAAKRAGETQLAACMVLATTRADVNGVVKRKLDVRKASFAPMDTAVELTGMEYGGITPLGLPEGWPLWLAPEVAAADAVVVGSGIRGSKLAVPGAVLAALPHAETVPDLAR